VIHSRPPSNPLLSPTESCTSATEVIRLAEELSADVLIMDDRLAVLHTRAKGFRVASTIAVYIEAKRRNLVGSVKENVDQLRTVGFGLTETDYRAVLAAAAER